MQKPSSKSRAFAFAQLINKTQRMLRGARHVPDIYWLDRMTSHRVKLGAYRLTKSRELIVPHLSAAVPKRFANAILHSMAIVQRIAASGALFDFSDRHRATVTANGITMAIQGYTELATFEEVVVRQFYRSTLRYPTVVIDIGMNVGLASLYYAADPNVTAVYGYEPFRPTYETALANFALNPKLSRKISPFNSGVDSHASKLTAAYSAEINTSLGLHSMTVDPKAASVEMMEINVEAASDIFAMVRAKHPTAALMIKIDCEGSEKTIVPALCALPGISDRTAMNIETHDNCDKLVVQSLENAGFKVFAIETEYTGVWLIHAVSGADW